MRAQGFGKRKNMVGMARAKKAKVEKVEALLTKAPVTEAVTMAAGDDSCCRRMYCTLEPQEPAAAARSWRAMR